jgi:hypothetical protein
VRRADLRARSAAGCGWRQELRAAVRRVVGIGEPAVDESIGDPLHALARAAHLARDPRDRQWLAEHCTEHLPPCSRQTRWQRESFRELEEPSVELEGRDRCTRQQHLIVAAHTDINSKKPAGSRSP